ncbi:MAG: hypothetical protein J6M18_03795 [Actinomycetaceae bacterium]|nr:hypothetical protein [Actinomycetaceae bacterium]
MSAIVIGESLIEVLKNGDEPPIQRPCGSMYNTAVALANLGRHTRFVTDYGTDTDGKAIHESLEHKGIHEVLLPDDKRDKLTTRAYVDMADLHNIHLENIHWNIPEAPTSPADKLDISIFAPCVTAFGSLACHVSPGNTRTIEWINELHEYSLIFYGPSTQNLGNTLTTSPEQVESCVQLADVVRISENDLFAIYGENIDFDALAHRWLELGTSIIAITHSGEGSVLYSCSGHRVNIPAQNTHIVDTFGAGDSYLAALMDGVINSNLGRAEHRKELANISEPTLRMLGVYATMAASLTIGRAGPHPPMRQELMDLYQTYLTNPILASHSIGTDNKN